MVRRTRPLVVAAAAFATILTAGALSGVADAAPTAPPSFQQRAAQADSYTSTLAQHGLASSTSVVVADDRAVVEALPGTEAAVRRLVPGATVVTSTTADAVAGPAACTDRNNCGAPLRGGITISQDTRNVRCSLGFTAHATDGSRWILSAGHCAGPIGEQWRHGQQPIGALRQSYNAFAQGRWNDPTVGRSVWLDFMRVRNQSSYWLNSSFGWMYGTPASPTAVNGAVAAGTLRTGQTICRSSSSAYHADNAANCGTVKSAYGPNGEIEVSGMIVCKGDSGGSVYVAGPDGTRLAVGLISGFYFQNGTSQPNCVQSGFTSLVSPIDSIYHYLDATTASNVRVDAR